MLLRSAQIFLAAEEALRSIDAIGVKAVETAVRSTRTRIAQDLETVISSRPAEIREHAAKVRGISEDGQHEVYFAAATKIGSALSELKGIRAQVADTGDEQTSKRVELLEQALQGLSKSLGQLAKVTGLTATVTHVERILERLQEIAAIREYFAGVFDAGHIAGPIRYDARAGASVRIMVRSAGRPGVQTILAVFRPLDAVIEALRDSFAIQDEDLWIAHLHVGSLEPEFEIRLGEYIG